MKNRPIYADNAATTKLDPLAFEAMLPWLQEEYGNASQPYSFARNPKRALREARETIADCIHAAPEEIFFTSGGTESDNWAIKGCAFADPELRPTITSAFEHPAVLNACRAIERLDHPVTYLSPTSTGTIPPNALASCITDRTRLVSVMLANNELGTIQPIRELCRIAHKAGALFHTDAVQALGHLAIDVQELDVDLLSASAHKFNGPKGVGFLYIRKGTPIAPYADGGGQEAGQRAGTENVAGIVGMSIALKENCKKLQENSFHLREMERVLIGHLSSAGICYTRNGSADTIPGLLSLSFPGMSGEAILHRLDLMGICIATGSACDSANTEISHVLKAISLDEALALGTVRISFGKNNTVDEAKQIAEALITIVRSVTR